jgi:hypothetical protein
VLGLRKVHGRAISVCACMIGECGG